MLIYYLWCVLEGKEVKKEKTKIKRIFSCKSVLAH
mgnify:CR=1 FL=1